MLNQALPTNKSPVIRRFGFGAWSAHDAFAYDLIAALKPKTFVELGSHRGESFFAFCQSVQENNLDTICYAVDTWAGDKHAGLYQEDVFGAVNQHNADHYASFAYLVRSTFDEAAKQFSDNSIDLLHIDGLHTYEAVKHDFDTWFKKLTPGGLILFHDIAVRHEDFGVWKFWEELKLKYPTFEFIQGYGLGVLKITPTFNFESEFLNKLFSNSPEFTSSAWGYYRSHHERLKEHHERLKLQQDNSKLQVELGDLSESHRVTIAELRLYERFFILRILMKIFNKLFK